MKYCQLPPTPALASVVKHYWSLEQSAHEAALTRELVLPDGCPEIVFNLSDRFLRYTEETAFEHQPRTLIAGQMTRSILIGPGGEVKLFGVRFQPYGASAFLDIPISDMTDRIESLDALFPKKESEFHERLLEAATFDECVAIFERTIGAEFTAKFPERRFCEVAELLARSDSGRIAQFAANVGWTERKLERDFKRYVGLSPKMYQRVTRFASIVRALEHFGPDELMDHAHELGYYDQPHMINEFRSFARESPTAFYARSHQLSELFTTGG